MRTAFSALLPFSLVFVFATTAAATVTLTAVGTILTGASAGSTDTTLASTGDQIQVDIFARNSGGALAGARLSAGVSGGGLDGLRFEGGLASAAWFTSGSDFTFDNVPSNNGSRIINEAGISNGGDGSFTSVGIPRTLTASDLSSPNANIVFLSGTGLGGVPTPFAGVFDLGVLDGVLSPLGGTPNVSATGVGAAHARLIFTLVGGFAALEIGQVAGGDFLLDENAPGGVGTVIGTTVEIGVIPEPQIALLLGLGIVGLAVRRI